MLSEWSVFGIVLGLSILECSGSQMHCNLPPSIWCSSVEVARACKVEEQCDTHVWSQQGKDDRVQLTLYLESLCPDCQNFVRNQLWPTYKRVADIMDLHLVPYGNAQEHQEGGKWVFECQHGENECLGNLIETCAIHFYNETQIWFPFIACMEMSHSLPDKSGPLCAKAIGIDFAVINNCTVSSLGNQLEHEMAVETESLDPPHTSVPWVTLNGVHTDEIQKQAETDLTKLICDTYKGLPKPEACTSQAVYRQCMRN